MGRRVSGRRRGVVRILRLGRGWGQAPFGRVAGCVSGYGFVQDCAKEPAATRRNVPAELGAGSARVAEWLFSGTKKPDAGMLPTSGARQWASAQLATTR
jgi:hypothetical protein